ncbi:MAG TPA: hypothetical protein VHJ78_05825 [Actinomycetota bacterium]|nr:hypothetical protein [Actinomycetota bacterium]
MTRVAVLGSGGATALLSAVLKEDPDIETVVRQDDLRSSVGEVDLIIGPWVENPEEARDTALAAIRAGRPYISPSSSPDVVEALLGLGSKAQSARTLVVAGMGWSPGISSLMVKSAASSLDTATSARVSWVASSAGSLAQSALSRALGLLTGEALVLENGKRHAVAAGERPEAVFFPEPVGWRMLRLARAAEPVTLPASFPELKNVVVKGALTDPLTEGILRSAGRMPSMGPLGSPAFSDKLLRVAGKVRPNALPWSAVRVDVSGSRDGRDETVTLGLVDQLPNLLVAPLVAAVQMLAGVPGARGAVGPEAIFDPEDFFSRLAYRGVRLAALERASERSP